MSTLHQTKIIPRAIIHVTAKGKNTLHINYGRRIYAILRRYTPEVTESGMNQCYAELTGLRTFFKMTYAEMVASILKDLKSEIGISFSIRIATVKEYETTALTTKKLKSVSTYKEINKLFAGKSYGSPTTHVSISKSHVAKKIKLTVPYIGKVS